jgi:hypothetical protein
MPARVELGGWDGGRGRCEGDFEPREPQAPCLGRGRLRRLIRSIARELDPADDPIALAGDDVEGWLGAAPGRRNVQRTSSRRSSVMAEEGATMRPERSCTDHAHPPVPPSSAPW